LVAPVAQHPAQGPQFPPPQTPPPRPVSNHRSRSRPHGTRAPSPTSPPRAHRHREIENYAPGPSLRSRSPSSELLPASKSRAALDITQLHAANNLLALKTAAWQASAHDTRLDNPVPALQNKPQPLKAIQPHQVCVLFPLRTSLRRFCRLWIIHRSQYGSIRKGHGTKPSMRPMTKLTSWKKSLPCLQ
jgi:hypothetical protein